MQIAIGGPKGRVGLRPDARLSEEIPWPYNRPFPFHRLVLRLTQRGFPFGVGVVVINSDGVGDLKVAVDGAMVTPCVPVWRSSAAGDLQIGQTRGIGASVPSPVCILPQSHVCRF